MVSDPTVSPLPSKDNTLCSIACVDTTEIEAYPLYPSRMM